ncbi:AraC family transcriptional regulator [Lachnospiraceae bacterium]|nr:AraC family transcriptional regulator [Lachnospiraceae bacterium]
MRHEIVSVNPDIEARFYLSIDLGSYVPPHWHDSLELVYMIEGSMAVTFENRREVLRAGEFNIVNSRVIHSVLSEKNKALVLQIPKEILRKFIPNIELYTFFVDKDPAGEVERTRLEKVKKIFMDMHAVYDIRPEGYLLRFNSLLYELLFTLVHSYSHKLVRKEFDRNEGQLEKVNPIMTYLKEHYREKCIVSELAEHFGYHEDYLARIFKKQLGMTIMEYVYAIRVSKVYIDLVNTERTVNEIFEDHGCTNYKVAMRYFKETYGCTPREKREAVRSMSWKEMQMLPSPFYEPYGE